MKVNCAKTRLTAQNSHVTINNIPEKLTQKNAAKICTDYDIIVDGSDNYHTRYIVNDTCKILNKPLVSASVFKFCGQLAVFNYQGGPCYRCLYPKTLLPGAIPNCSEAGVLGVVPGILGTLAANEVLKMILKMGNILSGKLLNLDALNLDIKISKLEKLESCPACNGIFFQNIPKERQNVIPDTHKIISVEQLHDMIKNHTDIEIIDVREIWEHAMHAIPNSVNIPLSTLANYQCKKNTNHIIFYCKSGLRSITALNLFSNQHINLYSLEDGILGWAKFIDNKTITY